MFVWVYPALERTPRETTLCRSILAAQERCSIPFVSNFIAKAVTTYTSFSLIVKKVTLGARGFLRQEPRSAISEARSGEEKENRQEARKPLVTRDS